MRDVLMEIRTAFKADRYNEMPEGVGKELIALVRARLADNVRAFDEVMLGEMFAEKNLDWRQHRLAFIEQLFFDFTTGADKIDVQLSYGEEWGKRERVYVLLFGVDPAECEQEVHDLFRRRYFKQQFPDLLDTPKWDAWPDEVPSLTEIVNANWPNSAEDRHDDESLQDLKEIVGYHSAVVSEVPALVPETHRLEFHPKEPSSSKKGKAAKGRRKQPEAA